MYGNSENERGLQVIDSIQDETKARLVGIHQRLIDTEEVASNTAEVLQQQSQQIRDTDEEARRLHDTMDKSKQLLNKFDWWAFHRNNNVETKDDAERILRDITTTPAEELFMYENQCYKSRTWRESRDPPPFSYLNGKIATEATFKSGRWKIEFTVPKIDQEGWTYASSFKAFEQNHCHAKPNWNCKVRRRRWRLEPDKKASAVNDVATNIRTREKTAMQSMSQRRLDLDPALVRRIDAGGAVRGVDLHSRTPQYALTETEEQRLAKVREKDEDIDQHIGLISGLVDTLETRARDMNQEVRTQNVAIESIETQMDGAAFRLAENNARAARHVKRR